MSSLFKPFLFVVLIFFLKVTILYPTVPQPNSVFSNCEDFVNVLDSANLVIPDIIHRALPDTHLKFKPYQDTKHREKSKVNMPRTQKVGAEKEASEPTGSPGTLAPHTHRHARRFPGIKPWEIYTVNRMWPPWCLHREMEGKENRVRWAAGSSRGRVSRVLLQYYCTADRGGETTWLSALNHAEIVTSPSPFFHGWQNLHSDSLRGLVFTSSVSDLEKPWTL